MKRTLIFTSALLLLATSLPVLAQNTNSPAPAPSPKHFYHLTFVVEEANNTGKITNSRTYQTTIAADSGDQFIKTGSRIPIATGSYQAGPNNANALVNTQFQYIDLGVNINIQDVMRIGSTLTFRLRANVSSLSAESKMLGSISEPIIRQNNWDSTVTVPLNKPTVVYSSDELDSKGKMQLRVTATPID